MRMIGRKIGYIGVTSGRIPYNTEKIDELYEEL